MKNSIYIVMLIGVIAIWTVLPFCSLQKEIKGKKGAVKPKTEITELIKEGKVSPGLIIFLAALISAGFGLGLAADLILFLKRLARRSAGTETRRPAVEVPWLLSDILKIAVIFLFSLTVVQSSALMSYNNGWVGRKTAEAAALVMGTLGVYIAVFYAVYHLLVKGYSEKVSALGLSVKGFMAGARRGIVGYFAFIPAFFALVIVSLVVCQALGVKPEPHEIVEIFSVEKSVYKIAYLVILAVFFAPVYEEVVFRGVIYPVLKKYFGVVNGMLASSFFFAAIHFNFAQFIPVFGLGIMLAYLYESTGTLTASIVFHAINNGIAVILTLVLIGIMR